MSWATTADEHQQEHKIFSQHRHSAVFSGTGTYIGSTNWAPAPWMWLTWTGTVTWIFLRVATNDQNQLFTNLGFSGAQVARYVDPGEVLINVSLMNNTSLEVDYSAEHRGGYSVGLCNPFLTGLLRTFGVVPNKQVK